MIIWDACIEEIALEGLDGITIPMLWNRLQNRPDIEFTFDDLGKQWIWNFIRRRRDVLSFYHLSESRQLHTFGDDESAVDERDMYPVDIIMDGDQWGSCSTFYTRSDLTEQICNGDDYGMLEDTLVAFDAERLVIVATQKVRNRVLFGLSCDYETLFRDSVVTRQHYAMLERIGRSRYSGVNAGANNSLHVLFNMRAKDVFYVVKRLESWGVIKRQLASSVVNQGKLITATVVTLARYNTPMERSKYLAPMRKLVAFLERKPDKRAEFAEVKELFGIATVRYVKKMLQTFPKVIRSTVSKVDVPVTPATAVRRRKKAETLRADKETHDSSNLQDNDESGPGVSVDQSAGDNQLEDGNTRSIIVRHYELVGKLHLDDETGTKPVAEDTDGLGEEEEDDEDACTSVELVDKRTIDWSRYNPFRSRVFESLRIIRQAGATGVDSHELRKGIGVDRKQMERLISNLKRGNQFKSVSQNEGKRRKTYHVWANAEHEAEQHFKKFEELTNLNYNQFGDKERLMLGEQSIKRMIFILERTEKIPVSHACDCLKALREWEQDQGYGHILDKKCFASQLKFLAKYKQINTFITILKEGSLQRTVEFICHKNVTLESSELQSKIYAARLELAQLNAKRTGQLSVLYDMETYNTKLRPLLSTYFNVKRSVLKKNQPGSSQRQPNSAKSSLPRENTKRKVAPAQGVWRRSHPAVQMQLQQRYIGEKESNKRRSRVTFDDIDKASFFRRKTQRSQFTQRERQMLLLIRTVSYVFYPGSRLWIPASAVRDVMHKYIPESRDKTSKTLVQSSSRELGTNPRTGESMLAMAEQLQKNQGIKNVKRRLSTMTNGPAEKLWAFEKAFEIAKKMFFGDDSEVDYDDLDLSNVYKLYDVSLEKTSKSVWPVDDVENLTDILENTARRVICSALSLSRRDGTFSSQLSMIYGNLPDTVLLRVFTRLRRNGMLVFRPRAKNQAHRKGIEGLTQKGKKDLTLSFFYRHFFYHHYHIGLAKEANALLGAMKLHFEDWQNVLSELPGNLVALISLSANRQVYFDLTVPSNVVAYSDGDTNRANASEADDDDDDWPRIISATTTNLLQDEDDDLDMDASISDRPSIQVPIVEVKKEPQEEEAVHLACHSANKWLLYKLRQERLNACESSDSRSITVRVRDLALNPCMLKAKLSNNYKDSSAVDQRNGKKAIAKLVGNVTIDSETVADRGGQETDSLEKAICTMLLQKGVLGLTEDEVREQFGSEENVRRRLDGLMEKRVVYVCGASKKRYLHCTCVQPWVISSVRYPKEARAQAQVMDTDQTEDNRSEPVKFMPRPWFKPDGTLNKPMLRWLCEGLFLRILSMPAVTDASVRDQFAPVLDPIETDELIQFMVDIGCVCRIEKEIVNRKPQLFGPPIIQQLKVVSFEIPLDAPMKFASIFERTPMPDFATHWAKGAEDNATIFGRRRFTPAPPHYSDK